MTTKRNIVGILFAVAIGLAAASPSFAAPKSGGAHTKPGGTSGTPCTVSPSSVAIGYRFTISASGLPVNHMLNINEMYPSHTRTLITSTSDGNLAATDTAGADWTVPAGQSFSVAIQINDVDGRKPVELATCSLQVN